MKKVLGNVGGFVKRGAKRAGLKISKRSPEILLGFGVISFVGTVFIACKQTLKAEEILDEHAEKIQDIEDVVQMSKDDPEHVSYSENDMKKDKAVAFVQTGWKFAKLYAPAIGLGAVSIACFGASYGIMRKRNVALSVAYAAVDQAFKEYRGRVREELGEDKDNFFRYGYEKVKGIVAVDDKTGNTREAELDTVPWDEEKKTVSGSSAFVYAPETSRYYQVDEIHNDFNISAARNNLQVDYDINGYLFLNDVLKALGMEPVPYGQLVGWIKGIGDPYLDFRVKKVYREIPQERKRLGVCGDYECIYEFDFNTCGVIWDKI